MESNRRRKKRNLTKEKDIRSYLEKGGESGKRTKDEESGGITRGRSYLPRNSRGEWKRSKDEASGEI